MTDQEYEKELRRFVIITLRRSSLRWYARQIVIKAARIERGLYKCAQCGRAVGPKEFNIDHINPVVDVRNNWTNYEDFIRRLLVKPEELQLLCTSPCHESKTAVENELRKINRKNAKKTLTRRKKISNIKK